MQGLFKDTLKYIIRIALQQKEEPIKYSWALAAIFRSKHTSILQISLSTSGMVGHASMVLWYPIKVVCTLVFDEVLGCLMLVVN